MGWSKLSHYTFLYLVDVFEISSLDRVGTRLLHRPALGLPPSIALCPRIPLQSLMRASLECPVSERFGTHLFSRFRLLNSHGSRLSRFICDCGEPRSRQTTPLSLGSSQIAAIVSLIMMLTIQINPRPNLSCLPLTPSTVLLPRAFLSRGSCTTELSPRPPYGLPPLHWVEKEGLNRQGR